MILTSRALTLVLFNAELGVRSSYQVVLRTFSSPAAVMACFDLDCCCAYVHAGEFYVVARFLRALKLGMNLFLPWCAWDRY